jgi:hypothetical protein
VHVCSTRAAGEGALVQLLLVLWGSSCAFSGQIDEFITKQQGITNMRA